MNHASCTHVSTGHRSPPVLRRKELVYTSRFVRAIRDSEDQSEQAQDRDTPPSPFAAGSAGDRRSSLQLWRGCPLPPQTLSVPCWCCPHAPRRHAPASVSCPCIRGSVHSLSLAVLPARTARTSGSFPMLPGSKPTLVLLLPSSLLPSLLHCRTRRILR